MFNVAMKIEMCVQNIWLWYFIFFNLMRLNIEPVPKSQVYVFCTFVCFGHMLLKIVKSGPQFFVVWWGVYFSKHIFYIYLSLNVAQKLVHILELDFDKRVYTKSTHVFEAYILCFRETRNDELQWKTYIAAYIALFSSLTDLPLSFLTDT